MYFGLVGADLCPRVLAAAVHLHGPLATAPTDHRLQWAGGTPPADAGCICPPDASLCGQMHPCAAVAGAAPAPYAPAAGPSPPLSGVRTARGGVVTSHGIYEHLVCSFSISPASGSLAHCHQSDATVDKHFLFVVVVVVHVANRSQPPLIAAAPVALHDMSADEVGTRALEHAARRAVRARLFSPDLEPARASLATAVRVWLAAGAVDVLHLEVRVH
jgi:hypothetical protein